MIRLCLAFLTLGAEAQCLDDACDETFAASTYLLQTQVRQNRREETCGHLQPEIGDISTMMNNNYKYHTHKDDFNKSIVQVMREHPGVDGYCWFNGSAMYIVYTGPEKDYVGAVLSGVESLRAMAPQYGGMNSGPEVTYHWEGEPVTTHLDVEHYVYDDLYAFSLGYLQGQGLDTSLIHNSTAWEELSRQQCENLQEKYQFKDEELVFMDILDMNMPIMAMCQCAAGVPLSPGMHVPYVTEKANYNSPADCQTITHREFARHHYMKCVLGYKNSASDMAYLHGRACLLDGNRIGHHTECPWYPAGIEPEA